MKLIDTHCHIQFDAYRADRDEVIALCNEKETGLLVVGCDYPSSKAAVELAREKHEMWASVGQHPTDTALPFVEKDFHTLAKSEKVVAIGECGLDYYRIPAIDKQETRMKAGASTMNEHSLEPESSAQEVEALKLRQKELLGKHIDLAHELHLPLIIHCRDAHDDMIGILMARFGFARTHHGRAHEHGVLHCFTGTARDAQSYLDLNFCISFTGIITFTDQYDEVVRCVPLDKLLIETDSPFLSPVPHRGKRNHPAYVRFVAERVAEIKGSPYETVIEQTTENAMRLFVLKAP